MVEGAIARRERFLGMRAFFEGVGAGETAGIWPDKPEPKPVRKGAIRVVDRRREAALEPSPC